MNKEQAIAASLAAGKPKMIAEMYNFVTRLEVCEAGLRSPNLTADDKAALERSAAALRKAMAKGRYF